MLAESVERVRHTVANTSAFECCTSDSNVLAHVNNRLVLFRTTAEGARVEGQLTCTDIFASGKHGVGSEWRSEPTGRVIQVKHIPVEVAPSIWLWHPERGLASFMGDLTTGSWATTLHIRQQVNVHYQGYTSALRVASVKEFNSIYATGV